jgi:hypothetical protein
MWDHIDGLAKGHNYSNYTFLRTLYYSKELD